MDTRKTHPGLRAVEKYAVRVGGGFNHRFGLDSGVLIKDNHIAAAGSVSVAIKLARQSAPHTLKIEIECETHAQLEEAIAAGADIVLLDNMTLEDIRRAVQIAAGRVQLEVSGNVTPGDGRRNRAHRRRSDLGRRTDPHRLRRRPQHEDRSVLT